MNKRPPLETASWVAGIASAIVAIVVWLKPPSAESSPTQPPSPNALAAPSPTKLPVPADGASAVSSPRPPSTRWSCAAVAADLQPAWESARKISYVSPRDAALADVARSALCLQDYALFHQIAAEVNYVTPRDQLYGDAVDFALGIGKFELAEQFASKISYVTPRDVARARIAGAATRRQ